MISTLKPLDAFEENACVKIDRDLIIFWLESFRSGDQSSVKFRRKIIDTFVSAVWVYDDRLRIAFNYTGKNNTVEREILEELTEKEIAPDVISDAMINATLDPSTVRISSSKLQREIARYDMSSIGFTIAPTMDCNMCCPYCYEQKCDSYMSEETQNAVVDFIKVHLDAFPNAKVLNIAWYGGEPLMYKEAIYNISEKLINICDTHKVSYHAEIITNGVLLDIETAKKLSKDCRVSRAQVTVDGLGDYHNKKRILKNGEDSYSIIIKNLEAANNC